MSSVLLASWEGGGNVQPMVELGRQLVARGHEVRLLGMPSMRSRSEHAGITFAKAADEDWSRGGLPTGDHLLGELDRAAADTLVVDFMSFGALSAAETTGIPTAALVHLLYGPIASGWMDGYCLRSGVAGVRSGLGVSPIESLGDLLARCALVAVATLPDLDQPPDPLPPNVAYVGALLEDGAGQGWTSPWADGDAPLVVVSLGTTDLGELSVLQLTLDAMASLPLRGLVNVGDHIDRASLQAPANSVVSGYVPHGAVLPRASVFVTHSGHGGMVAGLAAGVPMVCIPLERDQHTNANRIEALGAGVQLTRDASAVQVGAAITKVLVDPTYREAAGRLAARIAAFTRDQPAVAAIERLVHA